MIRIQSLSGKAIGGLIFFGGVNVVQLGSGPAEKKSSGEGRPVMI